MFDDTNLIDWIGLDWIVWSGMEWSVKEWNEMILWRLIDSFIRCLLAAAG
jgi:hypothetical protein